MKKLLSIAVALLSAGLLARGEGVAAGLKIGTLGPGIEAVGFLTSNLNLRVAGNYISLNINGGVDDIDYDADLRLASLEALLDFHPFENGFRITGGLVLNNNEMELKGTTSDPTIDIGDQTYPTASVGELIGKATFDEFVPYVGLGYGNAVADDVNFTFSFDLGVVFMGTPDVTLKSTGALNGDPAFQNELRKEEDDAQDFADGIKIYPVLSFGVCYYFW